MTLQRQLPGLPDQLRAEHAVLFLLDEAKAGPLIDMARGVQHVVGPQRQRFVSGLSREPHAFLDQPRADAEPARMRLDQQRSRLASKFLMKAATISATSASNARFQPYSCA